MEDSFPGGYEVIREAFKARSVSDIAIPALLASLSESTIKQYSYSLRFWWNYCHHHRLSLYSPSVAHFLQFLAQELPNIFSYSTLNTMRSAISLISQNEIGNYPTIKRFCRGISTLKPPRPRYDFVWNPAPVIAKLSSIYPYEGVSLKLILLLALATGHRAQTFFLLRILQISLNDKLIIRVPDRIKTSAPGRSQPFFMLSRFVNQENLCIVCLMEHYMENTKDLRPSSCDFLFISLSKPHKAVSSQTISRWIRSGLEDCGIDTSIFSAHSTRHASTSQASSRGVPLDFIKRAAGWTGESRVFANFYNRPPINPEEFSNSVLLAQHSKR
ncbi:uncharacterized protein LOC143904826 [Temnothorax americanus]|uniref:uncharacterized protein LOC143904826 n=1 Tax=Temnothorax americanus TaxID=1964332 RepID=UPI0040692F25